MVCTRLMAVASGFALVSVLVLVLGHLGHAQNPEQQSELSRSLTDTASLKVYDEYSWMWGDAGEHLFGHGLAELDPMRWSGWKTAAATLRELEQLEDGVNRNRPVELIGIRGNGTHIGPRPSFSDMTRNRMSFGNIGEVVAYLRLQGRRVYRWMWGDAGDHLLGHGAAEVDPFRWSDWQHREVILKDLSAYRATEDSNRPVEIMEDGGGVPNRRRTFPSVDAALEFLSGPSDENQGGKGNSNSTWAVHLTKETMASVLLAGAAITALCGCGSCLACLLSSRHGWKKRLRSGPFDEDASATDEEAIF